MALRTQIARHRKTELQAVFPGPSNVDLKEEKKKKKKKEINKRPGLNEPKLQSLENKVFEF